MEQHVKLCWKMQDPQTVCSNFSGEGGSARTAFPLGCSMRCQASRSLPTGLGFPGLLVLKFTPAKLNTRFINGGQQIAATSFVNM